MFRKTLALRRIPTERVEAFPGCQSFGTSNTVNMESLQELCLDNAYFIASDNTNFEVTAKYIKKENSEISEPVTVKNPFVVTFDSLKYDMQSKVKCLETSGACKIQIFKVKPSTNDTDSLERDGTLIKINQIEYSYFSTKSSDTLSFEVKQLYKRSEENNQNVLNYFQQSFEYQNADNSLKEVIPESTNENIRVLISADDLSNVKTFRASVEFPDVDFEQSNNYEGTVTIKINKKSDPPEGEEELLFEKDKEYVILGENKIKTKSEVEVETNTTSKEVTAPDFPNKPNNPDPTPTQKPSGLRGWQIALIVIGVIVVIAIIIVVALLILKKGKGGSQSGSGSGENV